MSERNHYTASGIAAMKDRLARAAIERYITYTAYSQVEGPPCLRINAENNYEFGLDHTIDQHQLPEPELKKLFHHVWPPIGPEHAGSRPTQRDLLGEWVPGSERDIWAEVYQPWFDRIDEVFAPWESLPDERTFEAKADAMRAGADPVRLNLEAIMNEEVEERSSDWGSTGLVNAVGNVHLALNGAGQDQRGYLVSTFKGNYADPLYVLIGQQYFLAQNLTAQLEVEARIWHRTRATVMEIGHNAAVAMEPFGEEPREEVSWLDVIGMAGSVVGVLARGTPVGLAGSLVNWGIKLYKGYLKVNPPPPPSPAEAVLNGYSPEECMNLVDEALRTLNRQITDEELFLHGLADSLVDATYQTSTRRDIYYNLGPPELLAEDDATRIANPAVVADFGRLRTAAAQVQEVAGYLDQAASGVEPVDAGVMAWTRDPSIGLTDQGPYDSWKNLHERTVWVLRDTASELRAAGQHLALAVDALENTDLQAMSALSAHTRDVADIAAPDPGQPREPDREGGHRR
jgi:hypothetical protein